MIFHCHKEKRILSDLFAALFDPFQLQCTLHIHNKHSRNFCLSSQYTMWKFYILKNSKYLDKTLKWTVFPVAVKWNIIIGWATRTHTNTLTDTLWLRLLVNIFHLQLIASREKKNTNLNVMANKNERVQRRISIFFFSFLFNFKYECSKYRAVKVKASERYIYLKDHRFCCCTI